MRDVLRPALTIVAALSALALVLAGCSGGTTSRSSQDTATETGEATSSPAPTGSLPPTGPPSVPPSAVSTIDVSGRGTVLATLKASGRLSTFADLVEQAGLAAMISEGDRTLFAPTNQAFAKLPADWLPKLRMPENRDKLIALLRYHVVSGKVTVAQMTPGRALETASRGAITIRERDGAKVLNDTVRIEQPDVPATDGVLHATDSVLVPPGFTP